MRFSRKEVFRRSRGRVFPGFPGVDDAEGLDDGWNDQGGIMDRSKGCEADTISKCMTDTDCELERQAGFAKATRAGEG